MTDDTSPQTTTEPAAPAEPSFNDALAFAQNVASKSEDASTFVELRKGEEALARDPAEGRARIQNTAKAMLSDPNLRKELTEERYRLQQERAEQAQPRDEQGRYVAEQAQHEQPQHHDSVEDDVVEQTRIKTAYQVKADQARQRLPDFDDAMSTFQYAPLRADIEREILKSAVGPDIAHMIGSSPNAFEIAEQLNAMSEAEAARWITKLEAKVEFDRGIAAQQQPWAREQAAQPRRQTQAPRPISAPTGGASPPQDLLALAKSDDVSQYVQERRRQERAR